MSTLQENQSLNAEYERNKKEREMKEEIERLKNQNKNINEMYELTKKEYIRLNNIIKEVREYIKENMSYIEKGKLEYIPSGEELLEILDKENI